MKIKNKKIMKIKTSYPLIKIIGEIQGFIRKSEDLGVYWLETSFKSKEFNIEIYNPFLNETQTTEVDPINYYKKDFLNSKFCRDIEGITARLHSKVLEMYYSGEYIDFEYLETLGNEINILYSSNSNILQTTVELTDSFCKDNMVWYEDDLFKLVAPCNYSLKEIYKLCKEHNPNQTLVINNILICSGKTSQ